MRTEDPADRAGRADQAAIRRSNLVAVLGSVRTQPRSRARLAQDLGLTRATVSSIVAELADRGLVRTNAPSRAGAVGRPSQQVELVPGRVLAVGLELNVDHLVASVLDLAGQLVSQRRHTLDVSRLTPSAAVDAGVELARQAVEHARSTTEARAGSTMLAGLGVAVPGLVDRETGVARVLPNLGWPPTPIRELIEHALRPTWPELAIEVDNEANLATLGESASRGHDVADLLYLTGGVGVGGGVIAGGRLVRGVAGFAGEVGHITIDNDGPPCGCGRRGCWETWCGLTALLAAAAEPDDPIRDPQRDIAERVTTLVDRARAGDDRSQRALDQVGYALGLGASILVNVLNPAVVVLGGYFADLGDAVLEQVRAELADRVVAPHTGGCRVELSQLGLAAASVGAGHAVLEPVLQDPTRVPTGVEGAPEQHHKEQHHNEPDHRHVEGCPA